MSARAGGVKRKMAARTMGAGVLRPDCLAIRAILTQEYHGSVMKKLRRRYLALAVSSIGPLETKGRRSRGAPSGQLTVPPHAHRIDRAPEAHAKENPARPRPRPDP